jgi:hypothetical protein
MVPKNLKAQQIDEKCIVNLWKFSAGESQSPTETYRLPDFNFDPPLNPIFAREGIEFFKDKTVKKYRVKLCGNDYGPNYTEGTWKIYRKKSIKMLKINFPNEENRFEIIEISKDKMVLKRI